MRRIRCYECGKIYNYDVDDFCPKCGAFNQPMRATRIDATGAVVRWDGINETNHAESFVHEELHEENRERRRMGLAKKAQRTAAWGKSATPSDSGKAASGTQNSKQIKKPASRLLFWIILIIILFNFLFSGLLRLFLSL